MSDGFDWNDEDTVLQEQPRTAVFLNAGDGVVIRQHNWPDDDSSVVIQPQNAIRFVLAVLAAAGHDDIELIRSCGGGYVDVEIPSEPRRPRERQESCLIDTAPAVAKSIRAAEAIKANPGKSNRAIAAELGVDEGTVRKARPAEYSAPERTGQDGKSYSVRQRVADDPPSLPELDFNNGGENTALTH